jgi:hypothetical protein
MTLAIAKVASRSNVRVHNQLNDSLSHHQSTISQLDPLGLAGHFMINGSSLMEQ